MSDLMTPAKAANYLGLSPWTLAHYRCQRTGPAFYRMGKKIRYAKKDLDCWTSSRREVPA